jgi:hypothetical protein
MPPWWSTCGIDRSLTVVALASAAMTSDTSTPAPTDSGSSRPSWLIPVIVVVVIVVLAAGAFVVYKLTDTKETAEAPITVVHRVVVAVRADKPSQANSDLTGAATGQVSSLTANQINGLKFNACVPVPQQPNARLCTWSRPGGQMSMALVKVNGHWKVNNVVIGPAGLPPATDTSGSTTSSTTTPPST